MASREQKPVRHFSANQMQALVAFVFPEDAFDYSASNATNASSESSSSETDDKEPGFLSRIAKKLFG